MNFKEYFYASKTQLISVLEDTPKWQEDRVVSKYCRLTLSEDGHINLKPGDTLEVFFEGEESSIKKVIINHGEHDLLSIEIGHKKLNNWLQKNSVES